MTLRFNPTLTLAILAVAGCSSAPAPDRAPAAVPAAAPASAAWTPPPIRTEPGGAIVLDATQREWVERTLARLPLERKVAQMVVPWMPSAYLPVDSDAFEDARRWVEQLGVGGIITTIGATGDMALRFNALQALADVPLLISTDMESGPGQRLDAGTVLPYGWDLGGGTDFPPLMGFGATADPALAEQMGRITATEARAVGFNWTFAPVVDVNSNADNPIINVRSYGEDPELVARMAVGHLTGLLGGGMIAAAKHFPGHGDVSVDSHIEMPLLSSSRAAVDALELVPYRAAIDAGVPAIMPAHIAYPALTGDSVPATLNPRILTGLLREELGFDGIIVTDALDMGALVRHYGLGTAAVRAVQAGADVLLQPVNVDSVLNAVVAAVRDGRIAESRSDASVRRILGAKAALGLHERPLVDLSLIPYRVGGRTNDSVAADVARASIVVARDGAAARIRSDDDVLHVVYAGQTNPWAGRELNAALAGAVREWELIRLTSATDAEDLSRVRAAVRNAETVLFSFFVGPSAGAGGVSLPRELAALVNEVAREKPAVGVSFGNPYLLREVPELDAYLLAWGGGAHQQRAAADVLLGRAPATGTLPISIPPLIRRGGAATPLGAPDLGSAPRAHPFAEARALDAQMDSAGLARVDALIERAIADRLTPGAALAVVRWGMPVRMRGYGRTSYDAGAPGVTERTRYDIASLTKVVGTTTAALALVQEGRLDLDATVRTYLPRLFPDTLALGGSDVDDPDAYHGPLTAANARITIRQLLTHTAGLPPFRPYWRELCGRDAIGRAIANEPLASMPGAEREYSDLGFIVLGLVIEAIEGAPLDEVIARRVTGPLGMDDTRYNPRGAPPAAAACSAPAYPSADALPLDSIAPTEDYAYRGGVAHGYVHDENAYALGGVSGHAGLYSTALDLALFSWRMSRLARGSSGAFDAAVARPFLRGPAGLAVADATGQRLGWLGEPLGGGMAEPFGATGFGHTGYTGTSIWVDPELDLAVVLLTNRVHPSREREGMGALRAAVSAAVRAAVLTPVN